MSDQRFIDRNTGKIIPQAGDLARMLEDVPLEGGAKLRADQNVLILPHSEGSSLAGIKWRDSEGTHVMAMEVSKLEVVL